MLKNSAEMSGLRGFRFVIMENLQNFLYVKSVGCAKRFGVIKGAIKGGILDKFVFKCQFLRAADKQAVSIAGRSLQ